MVELFTKGVSVGRIRGPSRRILIFLGTILIFLFTFTGIFCDFKLFEHPYKTNPDLKLLKREEGHTLFHPICSPDGQRVYYLDWPEIPEEWGMPPYRTGDITGSLWVVGIDGSSDTKLLGGNFGALAISLNGAKLSLTTGSEAVDGKLILFGMTEQVVDSLPILTYDLLTPSSDLQSSFREGLAPLHRIEGYVYDSLSGLPLDNAWITIWNPHSKRYDTFYTDSTGHYYAEFIRWEYTFKIYANKEKYYYQEKEYFRNANSPFDTIRINFYLKRKPDANTNLEIKHKNNEFFLGYQPSIFNGLKGFIGWAIAYTRTLGKEGDIKLSIYIPIIGDVSIARTASQEIHCFFLGELRIRKVFLNFSGAEVTSGIGIGYGSFAGEKMIGRGFDAFDVTGFFLIPEIGLYLNFLTCNLNLPINIFPTSMVLGEHPIGLRFQIGPVIQW